MDIALQVKRIFHIDIQRLLLIIGVLVGIAVVFQYHGVPGKGVFTLWHGAKSSRIAMIGSSPTAGESIMTNIYSVNDTSVTDINAPVNDTSVSDMDEETEEMLDVEPDSSSPTYQEGSSYGRSIGKNVSIEESMVREDEESITENSTELKGNVTKDATTVKKKKKKKKKWKKPSLSISQMNSILLQNYASSQSKRPKKLSARDRELQSARLEIENAPILRNNPELHASVYKNVSMFQRSYELMERTFKVYVYEDGKKPIYHSPIMRGIYASEGWFMKVMEGNKKFTVTNPGKAHVFYIPFSSQMLRNALRFDATHFHNSNDLANHLRDYVDLVAEKYPFWNRTRGADHFLVACHDWGPKLTSKLENCIRALCNADASKEFKFGRDASSPVTFIKTPNNPLKDLGGKLPTERPILAFFAGNMHGDVRPVLLQYWQDKEPDMAIFGRLPRRKGKRIYADYMKSSKYCICAKGYSVHTPRVVESIMHECVPVILADNYVPPFFEVLNWEAFAVFVKEKDIPKLRNILLSISEEKYLAMQQRVKMVQQHFLWHRKPVKYDTFHMILHSVWYNKVFQTKSK